MPPRRVQFVGFLAMSLILLMGPGEPIGPARAQSPTEVAAVRPRHVTAETEQAIQTALQWLAEQQQDNGSFGSADVYAQNIGITTLCGMAFLGSGSLPDSGPYAQTVSDCLDFILLSAAPNGFIVESENKTRGPMYGHGFATMFLAELYGTTQRDDLRGTLKRAVDLILATQNAQGGWRYRPVPEDADISVTVCEMMALRAARNAGIAVPKEIMDRAVEYIRQCQNADGGFRYRLFDPAESAVPRSAAAVVALYTAGISNDPAIEQGQVYLAREFENRNDRNQEYYFYGQYYSAQATWHAGPDAWDRWYPRMREELLDQRTPDGHWTDPYFGDEYATAMALIVLQMPYDYVPIFER